MLSRTEIADGVSGAWRLMWGDVSGLYMLDRTLEGFWRSFRVAILVAPLYAFGSLIVYERTPAVAPDTLVILVETLHYLIKWTAFPVLLLEIARRTGWTARYIGAVVAMNWSSVPVVILSTMALAIGEVGPTWLGQALSLGLMAISVFWLFRILRGALNVSVGQALALALLDLWIGVTLLIIINSIVGRLPAGGV